MLYMNLSVICVMQIICRIHGRHLHQRVEQHKHSVVGKHFTEKHEVKRVNRGGNFKNSQEMPREARVSDFRDFNHTR